MAYIEPKTDWNTAYEPSVEDMNRIEGNIETIVEKDLEFNGLKTFNENIKTDSISDISGNGVNIDDVTLKDGVIYGLVWGA